MKGVNEKKRLDKSHGRVNFAFSVISRQLQVGCSIRKVRESPSDVLGSMDDAGTKILI
jgi:hypothetical protein